LAETLFETNDSAIQFSSLGSGSKGNGTLVVFGATIILVDCGFSIKESIRRLAIKRIKPEQLTAILVTHEHSDHISGVAGLANKFSIPVWINVGTSLHKKAVPIRNSNLFNSHHPFEIGAMTITPVPVPHDSREATQFLFSACDIKLGILTDVGHITQHIIDAYAGCAALLLEFNYDYEMLINGKYPYSLKQRVAGNLGHLSNDQAIRFLQMFDSSKLEMLTVMHRSEENNSEEIIREKLESLIEINSVGYFFAEQGDGFGWRKIERNRLDG